MNIYETSMEFMKNWNYGEIGDPLLRNYIIIILEILENSLNFTQLSQHTSKGYEN